MTIYCSVYVWLLLKERHITQWCGCFGWNGNSASPLKPFTSSFFETGCVPIICNSRDLMLASIPGGVYFYPNHLCLKKKVNAESSCDLSWTQKQWHCHHFHWKIFLEWSNNRWPVPIYRSHLSGELPCLGWEARSDSKEADPEIYNSKGTRLRRRST